MRQKEPRQVMEMQEAKRVEFTVPGEVMGKPRPRFARNGRVYTPKKCVQYEKLIAAMYRETGCEPFCGPIMVKVDTYRALPKSRPKKATTEPDTYKPDADNVLKVVLDALNGVAYRDDSQVVVVQMTKHPRSRVEEHLVVEISEVV